MGPVQLNSVTKAQRMQRQSPSFANSLCVLCVFMTFPLLQRKRIVKLQAAGPNGPPPAYNLLANTELLNQCPVLGNVFLH